LLRRSGLRIDSIGERMLPSQPGMRHLPRQCAAGKASAAARQILPDVNLRQSGTLSAREMDAG
jgi:hypothetical protein